MMRHLALALALASTAAADDDLLGVEDAETPPVEETVEDALAGERELAPDLQLREADDVREVEDIPHAWVGATVGLAIPSAKLRLGPTVGLEAAWVPRFAGGRLQPWLGASYGVPTARGEALDERFDESVAYRVSQRIGTFAAGAMIQFVSLREAIQAGLVVAPALHLLETRVTGTANGSEMPPTQERFHRLGFVTAFALSGSAGPGRVVGQVGLSYVPLGSEVTGPGGVLLVLPTIGYRVMF